MYSCFKKISNVKTRKERFGKSLEQKILLDLIDDSRANFQNKSDCWSNTHLLLFKEVFVLFSFFCESYSCF